MPTDASRQDFMKATYEPLWVGHPSVEHMHALLSWRYIWPKMEDVIEAYVRTCVICQKDKLERKKEAGLLQPLPILDKPFQSVSMDFISGFPKAEGMASIFVVIYRFSKYVISIACPKGCQTKVAAALFMMNVVKYFGIPEDIINDQDT